MSNNLILFGGIDFETYCALDLKEVGLARYINHPTFITTLASFAPPNGPTVRLEFPHLYKDRLRSWVTMPGLQLCAHNAGFEKAVFGWLGIEVGNIYDSAVVAAMAGADRSLASAARQLLDMDKLDEDRSLLNRFAKKQKDQAFDEFDICLIHAYPDEWQAYGEYCDRDAELSRDIVSKYCNLPNFDKEMGFAEVTQQMNEVGWPVDMDSVVEMKRRYQKNLDNLLADFATRVDPDLNINSPVQVKRWCADRGVTSKSFDKQNVERMIARLEKLPHLDDKKSEVLELLLLKQMLGGSSLKKLDTIITTAHNDRVFDQYVHGGAAQSMRTSGRSIQMQNLPQLKHQRSMRDLHVRPEQYWSNDELAGNLRQVFRSSKRNGVLVVADFASIESRALAYQAGEDWKTQAYHLKRDVYKEQAVKIFGLGSVDDVTKEQRTTGKVGELSCGYGAGAGAVKDFAAKMHVDLSETEAAKLVRDWRQANPNIVDYWNQLGDGFSNAVLRNQVERVVAGHGLKIKFVPTFMPASLARIAPAGAVSITMEMWKDGYRLFSRIFHGCYMRGSNVGYFKPSSLKGGRPWKDKYVDPKTKRQRYYELYGGKIAGILTQSMCREVFFEALLYIHFIVSASPNIQLIGQFHDEVVLDWTPGPNSLAFLINLLEKAMSSSATHPQLPMGVEVKHDYRYTK